MGNNFYIHRTGKDNKNFKISFNKVKEFFIETYLYYDNSNIFNEAKNIIDGTDKKMEISQFNGPIKIYNGTQMGVGVKSVLDTVITSNKTKENKNNNKGKENKKETITVNSELFNRNKYKNNMLYDMEE